MDAEPVVVSRHEVDGRTLELAILLACNTTKDRIDENIRINAALDLPWLGMSEAHDGAAVIIGGGPSAADCIPEIEQLARKGATVFALNGASKWARSHGIGVSYQVMIDARPENINLLDTKAPVHLMASQAAPNVVDAAENVILMHLSSEGCEDHIPEARKAKGGYVLVGGGYGVGNTAICAAYVMGYREMHCFGFDSSHRNGRGHAYEQPINDGIECVVTEFQGRRYVSSLPMKAHADRFMVIANDLEKMGCAIRVHGSGLLPAMFNHAPSEGNQNG
jgi:hypothetical protein